MPERIGRALGLCRVDLVERLRWGSVVFMTPALRNIAAIQN
jgi:hypothetical protein